MKLYRKAYISNWNEHDVLEFFSAYGFPTQGLIVNSVKYLYSIPITVSEIFPKLYSEDTNIVEVDIFDSTIRGRHTP